jgi:hypothetical protein
MYLDDIGPLPWTYMIVHQGFFFYTIAALRRAYNLISTLTTTRKSSLQTLQYITLSILIDARLQTDVVVALRDQ